MNDRLWVTGVGLVTPLGADAEATWSELVRGKVGIGPLRLFDLGGPRAARAAEVAHVAVPRSPRGAWSRTAAMALAAAREAMTAARLETAGASVGLVVGGTTGGMLETELLLAGLHGGAPLPPDTLAPMLSHPLTAAGDCIEERLGPFARVRSLSSACSSGANALVVGAGWLRSGEVDAVVAGGADGLCRLTLAGFNSIGALDPDTCRPFDRRRRGTSLGEGAGFVVLERAERARARGVDPIAELSGWAVGSEAHHVTRPAPDGSVMADLVGRALARAGLSPRDLDYVNAHGTGTPANDAMEAAALARALGGEIGRVPVSSSKGQIGHTLGAAGAIEAALTALVVARRVLVPTAGLEQPDPELDLVHVPHIGRTVPRVRAALSNAFGFGGMGTVLVLTDPDRATARAARVAVAGAHAAGPAGDGSARLRAPARAPVVTAVSVLGAAGLFGAAGCADLAGSPAAQGASGVDPDDHLDADRARRLDRAAKLATVAVDRVLREAAAAPGGMGVVFGSAFGSVDGCAAFMRRVTEKGIRAASPAEFPNLVPSSAVGHVSIYAGMHGPAFMTADLATSGESAFAQAVELVRAGEAGGVVACASAPESGIVDRVLGKLFALGPARPGARRRELGAAVCIESDAEARGRGARVLARVAQVVEWRAGGARAVRSIRPPDGARPEVVWARPAGELSDLLVRSGWQRAQRWCCDALGESDVLGLAAVCVAAARIGAGRASEVLVAGLAPGRGYAIVLVLP